MMIFIIGKRIKIENFELDGFKISLKINNNWYYFKLTKKEIELLDFMLRSKI